MARAERTRLSGGRFCLAAGCSHSRRGSMTGLAPPAASAVLPAPRVLAQGSARRIDVHHHVLPPDLIAKVLSDSMSDQGSDIVTSWTAQKSIEQMDKNGIATSIASLANP